MDLVQALACLKPVPLVYFVYFVVSSSEIRLNSVADMGAGNPALPARGLAVHILDPLRYTGWDSLLAGQAEASFFHTAAWAEVLKRTYGHVPVYFCQFVNDRLTGLLPVMEVGSPFTGRRGVSLPFSDFCPPLKAPDRNSGELYERALEQGRQRRWRYLECRGSAAAWPGASPALAFYGHVVDLGWGPERLLKNLHPAMRRGIRKAEETQLRVEFSDSPKSVREYYALHCQTRRRLGVPPQPARFFRNIAACVMGQGHGFVATTRLRGRPVASAIFFHYGRQAVYKFGASDYAVQQMRPNNLLFWESMKRLAEQGFTSLHLGRTSLANQGLRRFKLSLGAREEQITHYKYDFARGTFVTDVDRAEGWSNGVFRLLPLPLLRLVGACVYPHLS